MNEVFLKDKNNLLDEMQVDIGAAANDSLNKVSVSSEKKRAFRQTCRSAVLWMLLKLQERLPTNKAVIVQVSCLSPKNMVNIPAKAAKRFNGLADSLYSLKFISSYVADSAKYQYSQLLNKEVVMYSKKFVEFDFNKQRLDSFFYPVIGTNLKYVNLWIICQLVFILNHGQAFTERGFSVNKKVSDDNMEDDSLVAQRLIYDAIKSSGCEVSEFPIMKKLRKICKQSRSRMLLDKEKEKCHQQKSAKDLKRKAKRDEIDEVKKAKIQVEKSIGTLKTNLTKQAITSGTESGSKGKDAATKAAAFAKEMLAKEATLKNLCEAVQNLEAEYKAMEM